MPNCKTVVPYRGSPEQEERLRRNCFFVCGARCAAAPRASALPVTLRVGRMAGSLSGHSAKNAAGLRPACFFASMSS